MNYRAKAKELDHEIRMLTKERIQANLITLEERIIMGVAYGVIKPKYRQMSFPMWWERIREDATCFLMFGRFKRRTL